MYNHLVKASASVHALNPLITRSGLQLKAPPSSTGVLTDIHTCMYCSMFYHPNTEWVKISIPYWVQQALSLYTQKKKYTSHHTWNRLAIWPAQHANDKPAPKLAWQIGIREALGPIMPQIALVETLPSHGFHWTYLILKSLQCELFLHLIKDVCICGILAFQQWLPAVGSVSMRLG